jgi:uncharacterized membrane protein
MANTTMQQIMIGVITGVIVMIIAGYLQRKFITPPVAQQNNQEQSWYSEAYKSVYGWFG